MFYLVFDKKDNQIKDTIKYAARSLNDNVSVEINELITWCVVFPDVFESIEIVHQYFLILTTMRTIETFLKDEISNNDTIIYISNIISDYHWFQVRDINNWIWFFYHYPLLSKEIEQIEGNNEQVLFLSWCPNHEQDTSRFKQSFYNIVNFRPLATIPSNKIPIVFQYNEQFIFDEYLNFVPNEEDYLYKNWEICGLPWMKGYFYWTHPELFLNQFSQLYQSNQNIWKLTDTILNKEYDLWLSMKKEKTLPHRLLYFLKHLNHDKKNVNIYHQSQNPVMYVIPKQKYKDKKEKLTIEQWIENIEGLHAIELTNWKPIIKRRLTQFLQSTLTTETEVLELWNWIHKLHNYFLPLDHLHMELMNIRYFHIVSKHFIWFPFQEEFAITDKLLEPESIYHKKSLEAAISSKMRISERILNHSNQVDVYYKSLDVGIRFIHMYRTTDWSDFNFFYWWCPEKSEFVNIYHKQMNCMSSKYKMIHDNFHQEFALVWVWDIFAMPFIFPFNQITTYQIDKWYNYINNVWDNILNHKYYYCNEQNSPIIWVAIPKCGWNFFITFLKNIPEKCPSLKDVIWNPLIDYPIRNDLKNLTYTNYELLSTEPPYYIQIFFGNSCYTNSPKTIDFLIEEEKKDGTLVSYCPKWYFPGKPKSQFRTIPKKFPNLKKNYFWYDPDRLDHYDLYHWAEWFQIIDRSWNKILNTKPNIISSPKQINSNYPWNQWFSSQQLIDGYLTKLQEIAYRAQQSELLFVILVSNTNNTNLTNEGWRCQWWKTNLTFEKPVGYVGYLLNCSVVGSDNNLTDLDDWNYFVQLILSRLSLNSNLPKWLPIENLHTM